MLQLYSIIYNMLPPVNAGLLTKLSVQLLHNQHKKDKHAQLEHSASLFTGHKQSYLDKINDKN